MSRFPVGGFGIILKWLPGFVQAMVGVTLEMLATPVGQLSILYVHVVTLLVCVGWALGPRFGLGQRRDRPGDDGLDPLTASLAGDRAPACRPW